ncbi:MAG: heparinase II/III family protein [Pseudomonadota bacterium]
MSAQSLQLSPASFGSVARQASRSLAQALAGRVSRFIPSQRLVLPTSINGNVDTLRRGNPDKGFEFYRGRFELAGETVNVGARLPFSCEASDAWHEALHRFGWLADLAAAGSELQRAQARAFLLDWISNRESHHDVAMDLGVGARRLINLILHCRFMLDQSGEQFEDQFYESVARHVRWLQKRLPFAPAGYARLEAALALSYAAVCFDTGARFRDAAFLVLSRELDAQILPDGCHISRNAESLTDILLDLVPLVEMIDRQRIEPQQRLCAAIDRAVPALRMLCHGDAGLAAFNGVSKAMRGAVRLILERDEIGGKPVSVAAQTGYARLSHLRSNVIVDCGTPPPPAHAGRAHCGALGFEFSEGPQRIIVSCGESPAAEDDWNEAMRTTAAHSAVVLGERASGRMLKSRVLTALLGGPLVLGPHEVDCQVDRHDAGTLFSGRHDGYLKALGLVHERALWLSSDGLNLRGEDSFIADGAGKRASGPVEFAVRFHLHPSVKATLSKDQSSAVLLLPDRSGWRFSARGARLTLENSVYLIDRPVPQRTVQLVLSGLAADNCSVNWALKKLEKQGRTQGAVSRSPQLPL